MKQLLTKTKLISVFILALFLGCENDDNALLPQVLSSFTFNLDEDTGTVEFINISEKATSYEWDFGDGDTSTEINPVKTYGASGTYTVVLTAFNTAGASNTFESEITINIPVPPSPLALPIDFDGTNVAYGDIVGDNIGFSVVANPEAGNGNDTNVGQMETGGGQFQNAQFPLGTAVDFSGDDKTIELELFASAAIDVLVKFEDGAAGARDVEVLTTHTGSGWETLSFDFATNGVASFIQDDPQNGQALVPDGQYSGMVLFIGFNTDPGVEGTFLVDNIIQTTATPTPSGCADELIAATTLPVDFEGCETFLSSQNFGDGITSELVENPFKTGINTSDFVLQVDKPSGSSFFAGIQNTFEDNFDLTTTDVFSLKVYSTKANVVFRFELALNPQTDPVTGNPAPVFVTVPNANEWTEVQFTFTGLPGGPTAYNQLVIKPDNDMADSPIDTDGTYYFDDLTLGTSGGGGGFDSGLLTNGDFESGVDPWIGNAANVQTEGGNSFNFANVTTATPSEPFQVNLSQVLNITEGEDYILTFDASSDRARTIIAGIGLNVGPFTNVSQTVNLTTDTQTFVLNLNATGFGGADSRVLFDMAAEVGTVVIDNVSLVVDTSGGGADTTPPVISLNGDAVIDIIQNDPFTDPGATATDDTDGPITGDIVIGGDVVDVNTVGTYVITYDVSDAAGNAATQVTRTVNVNAFDSGLLTNGDFESGVSPWIGNAANVQTEGGNSFNFANVTTATPSEPFQVNLSQVVTITQDEDYILTFNASSDRNRTIIAGIGLNVGPFTNVNETVNLTTETQTFVLNLNATGFGGADSRVLFDMAAEVGTVVIDNVSLVVDTSGGGGGGGLTPLSSLPANFEGGEEFGAVFEPANVNGSIISNPVSGGINTSANVYEFNKPVGTEFYGGMENVFASPLDLTTTRTFKVKVYSSKPNIVVQFELQSRPTSPSIPNYSLQQTVTNANEWVELTFDFGAIVPPTFDPNIYNAIVIIPDFDTGNNPTSSSETYYIDDVILE